MKPAMKPARALAASALSKGLFVLLSIGVAPAASAATVEVSLRPDYRYLDAGTSRHDEAQNLQRLTRHLQQLGQQRLPADQTLQVQLVEVDLAGDTWPTHTSVHELRIARGGADFPRLTLRYALKGADGQVLRSGEDQLADMNYLRRPELSRSTDPLRYEKRMLDDWFRARFAAASPGR